MVNIPVLDTTEEGDLDKCEVVGPYAETLKVSVLLAEDNFSYSVNVYDDGDILEIVVTVGEHHDMLLYRRYIIW